MAGENSDHPPVQGGLFQENAPKGRTSARGKEVGRPYLPADERRTVDVHVRLSPQEVARLAKKVAKAGIPLATFLRQVALGSDPVRIEIPAVNHEARAELADIGRNLNQIARAMNAGVRENQPAIVPDALAAELARLREQVEAVALTLASGIKHGG